MIKFLKNKEIDKQKWDNCLEKSSCAKMYVYSWYLDIISPNWGGLIEDDYASIFPINKSEIINARINLTTASFNEREAIYALLLAMGRSWNVLRDTYLWSQHYGC